jgi:hypothetical protein
MIGNLIVFIMKMSGKALILMICLGLVFVGYKANQPMTVSGFREGMTYFEFISDRIDAAKTVEPSKCDWGIDAFIGHTRTNLLRGVYSGGN